MAAILVAIETVAKEHRITCGMCTIVYDSESTTSRFRSPRQFMLVSDRQQHDYDLLSAIATLKEHSTCQIETQWTKSHQTTLPYTKSVHLRHSCKKNSQGRLSQNRHKQMAGTHSNPNDVQQTMHRQLERINRRIATREQIRAVPKGQIQMDRYRTRND